jgi:phosphoglycerate dehydrogenase-like enzyme
MPMEGVLTTPAALDPFDALFALAIKITPASLAGVSRLAIVARWGVGYDRIDVPALTAAGVALAITPEAVKRPVAEAILTLVFALSKDLWEQDRTVRLGNGAAACAVWGDGRGPGADLRCGNIARELFRLAIPLGFGRLRLRSMWTVPRGGIELVSLEEVLRSSDYVSINTPLNSSTLGLIGGCSCEF